MLQTNFSPIIIILIRDLIISNQIETISKILGFWSCFSYPGSCSYVYNEHEDPYSRHHLIGQKVAIYCIHALNHELKPAMLANLA